MADNDVPHPHEEIEVITKKDPAVHKLGKRRRHGYRGYPNNPSIGGDVHTGSGFAGVGSTAGSANPSGGLIGEKTQESVEELAEEEEEKE
jgi:hypothetical protein